MVDKKKALERLQALKEKCAVLRANHAAFLPAKLQSFIKWKLDTQTAIEHIFTLKPGHVHRFNSIVFEVPKGQLKMNNMLSAPGQAYEEGLSEADAVLQSLIEEVRDYWNDGGTSQSPFGSIFSNLVKPTVSANPEKVFVVHGRNDALRRSMFEFLHAIGLRPVEWSEAVKATGKANPYVGEVLEKAFSMAQAVVVLMTPDDEARLKKEFQLANDNNSEKQLTGQARANVLFEAGMAMGRDEKRTILVEVGSLRPFSDVGGRHVVRMNNSSERRQDLAERLETAGCPVKLTGTRVWHSAGSFDVIEPNGAAAVDERAPASSPVTIPLTLSQFEIEVITWSENDGLLYLDDVGFGRTLINSQGRILVDGDDASVHARSLDALEMLIEKKLMRPVSDREFMLTGLGFEERKRHLS